MTTRGSEARLLTTHGNRLHIHTYTHVVQNIENIQYACIDHYPRATAEINENVRLQTNTFIDSNNHQYSDDLFVNLE